MALLVVASYGVAGGVDAGGADGVNAVDVLNDLIPAFALESV